MEIENVMMKIEADLLDINNLKQELSSNNNLPTTLREQVIDSFYLHYYLHVIQVTETS